MLKITDYNLEFKKGTFSLVSIKNKKRLDLRSKRIHHWTDQYLNDCIFPLSKLNEVLKLKFGLKLKGK